MKKILLLSLLLLTGGALLAENEELTAFLKRACNPNAVATYAALSGKVNHRRKGEKLYSESIYFALLIAPDRMTGQVMIGGKEGYLIGQSRKAGNVETSVLPMPKSDNSQNRLGWVGLRASDLTMGFLYYPPVRELEPAMVSIVPCRVVLLSAPDRSEVVKVYIAKDHAFPLKAEFFNQGKSLDGTPERTLETADFAKKNDLYFVRTIKLSGPGWRTQVVFDEAEARVGLLDPAKPPRIVRQFK